MGKRGKKGRGMVLLGRLFYRFTLDGFPVREWRPRATVPLVG